MSEGKFTTARARSGNVAQGQRVLIAEQLAQLNSQQAARLAQARAADPKREAARKVALACIALGTTVIVAIVALM